MTPRRHHRRPSPETPGRPNRAASRRATAPGAGTLLPAAGSAASRWRRSLGNRRSRTKAASPGPSDSYQRAPRAPTPASTSSVPAPVRGSAATASRRHSALVRATGETAAGRRERCVRARRTLLLMEWGIENSFEVLFKYDPLDPPALYASHFRLSLCGTERQV